jgi:hypothetical protein
VNNDLIDLTADSDDDSPPTTTTVAAMADPCVPPASDRAVKRMDEADGAGISSVLPARPPLPSPPASPPPYAMIRDPPPSGPRPRPFADVRTYSIRPDVPPIASGSLTSRPQCVVAYDAGYQLGRVGTCLDDALCIDVRERLKTWEPYWKIVEVR